MFHVPLLQVAATDPELNFACATAALPNGQTEAFAIRRSRRALSASRSDPKRGRA